MRYLKRLGLRKGNIVDKFLVKPLFVKGIAIQFYGKAEYFYILSFARS